MFAFCPFVCFSFLVCDFFLSKFLGYLANCLLVTPTSLFFLVHTHTHTHIYKKQIISEMFINLLFHFYQSLIRWSLKAKCNINKTCLFTLSIIHITFCSVSASPDIYSHQSFCYCPSPGLETNEELVKQVNFLPFGANDWIHIWRWLHEIQSVRREGCFIMMWHSCASWQQWYTHRSCCRIFTFFYSYYSFW